MPLLKPSLQTQVRDALAGLAGPVRILVFTTDQDPDACNVCDDTRQLVEELACLSDGRILAETYDLARDGERARAYGVERAPAVVVLGGPDGRHDYGVRFFGIPSGYEFASLVAAGDGRTALSPATLDILSRLTTPLHIRVFVTPTCPYCPPAVMLAHELAVASEHVTAEMIDASEFPDLADQYHVHAVPRTVMNDAVHVEGAVPEERLAKELAQLIRPAFALRASAGKPRFRRRRFAAMADKSAGQA
jgi:glutaredoxin-like protein